MTNSLTGHIDHIFEDLDLTFGEIKDILRKAFNGKLQACTEKFDGQNIIFTFKDNGFLWARNQQDIIDGGLNSSQFIKRYCKNSTFLGSFKNASVVLQKSFKNVNLDLLDYAFHDGQRWFSLEIICSQYPNTINYDYNCLIVHQSPFFELRDEEVRVFNRNPYLDVLQKVIDQMKNALSERGWQIQGDNFLRLGNFVNGSFLVNCCNQIDQHLEKYNLEDHHKLSDYILADCFWRFQNEYQLNEMQAKLASERVAHNGNPSMLEIKKQLNPEDFDHIHDFLQDWKSQQKISLGFLESLIYKFSIEMLRGLQSALIDDPQESSLELKTKLKQAITILKDNDDLGQIKKELTNLGGLDNINPIEGLVFQFKGKLYKFTGNFSSINKIIFLSRKQ